MVETEFLSEWERSFLRSPLLCGSASIRNPLPVPISKPWSQSQREVPTAPGPGKSAFHKSLTYFTSVEMNFSGTPDLDPAGQDNPKHRILGQN
jgi:hypothetical protein